MNYNPKDKISLIQYAKKLEGKSLRETCVEEIVNHSFLGKGNFGQILEKYYFGYDPNSKSEADFSEIGMELKSSPLKQLKNNEYRSKERLVLSIIDYLKIVKQDFDGSDFWKKNASILLIFYLYQTGVDILDFVIKLVGEWNFPIIDLEIIKKDWEFIKKKVADGKAHELSEGDTLYLGACTKGTNANSIRRQPFNEIPAKQRAYSLKQGYVNHIIASIAGETQEGYGKLITSVTEAKKKTLEEIVTDKFKMYYGKTVDEISKATGVSLNMQAKNFYSNVTHAILNVELHKEIEEFGKADIEVKAIRVENNNKIVESISFPAFEFEKIYNESWISSEMKSQIERKFLFVFFKNDVNGSYRLEKIKFWNMPFKDRNQVRVVWLATKRIIQTGTIFKGYDVDRNGNIKLSKKGNKIKLNNFPKMIENPVCHIRPHGRDSTEMFPLPIVDKTLGVKEYSKQAFWLKNAYVRDEVYLKR